MAERGSIAATHSNGNSHSKGAKGVGWEEAKAEFYQEAFHTQGTTTSTNSEENKGQTEKNVGWETLLPSKKATNIDSKTWGKATSRRNTVGRTLGRIATSQSMSNEYELETMPDLSQGFADEEETWQEIQRIRSLPLTMEEKRRRKNQLMQSPTLRMRGLERIKFRRRQLWRRFHYSLMQWLSHLSPWKYTIRSIEANFGTGVGSYFLLVRWLVFLNLSITGLMAVFIVVPWEVGKSTCPNLNLTSVTPPHSILDECRPSNLSLSDSNLYESDDCWLKYQSSVFSLVANHSDDAIQLIQDTIKGTGWLELTLAFYGYYHPVILSWGDDYTYNMAVGYEVVVFLLLLLSLICIARSVATGFKDNIGLGRSWLHKFSDLAFTSWDYCTHSAKVAQDKKKAIANAFRVALADKEYAEEKAARNLRIKIRLFFVRLGINFLVLATLTLSGYIIYLVTNVSEAERRKMNDNGGSFDSPEDFRALVIGFLPSIVITALNFLVPVIFRALVRLERFSATFEIKVTLVRTIFLRLASLLVLVLTLYSSLKENEDKEPCDKRLLNRQEAMCWETYVGQQLYRLSVFDIFISTVMTLLIELPLALSTRRMSQNPFFARMAHPEFNLAGNTLDLVYSQSICWLGMFYSPIIPILTVVKCLIVFYIKYLSLLLYSSPPARLYGASSSTSLFMNVLLLSFITCVLPLGYHVSSLTPSRSCGAYRGFSTVWSPISTEVDRLPGFFRTVLSFFGTAGFFVPAVLILLVAIYYFRSKALAQRAMVESLTKQLIMEAEDKQFLLTQLSKSQPPQAV